MVVKIVATQARPSSIIDKHVMLGVLDEYFDMGIKSVRMHSCYLLKNIHERRMITIN